MTQITKKDIRKFVVKGTTALFFWFVYFALAFLVPIRGRNGIQFVAALIMGEIKFDAPIKYVHLIFLILYLLSAIFCLKPILKTIFSKDRFSQKENEVDSLYVDIAYKRMTPALFSLLLGFSFFVTAWILGEMFDPSSSDSFIFLFGKKIDVSALSSSGTIFYYAELAVYAIVGLLLGLYSLISVGKSEKKNKTNALDQRADALVKQRVNQIQSEKRKMEQSAADKASDKLDNINIIEEYKKMLDDGIITQEEFEKKKKEFLEL